MGVVEIAENSTLIESSPNCIEWKIKDFLKLPTSDYFSLDSQPFSLLNSKWDLEICTNGDDEEDDSIGTVFLYLYNKDPTTVYDVSYTMGIKDVDGDESIEYSDKATFAVNGDGWGCDLIERSDLIDCQDSLLPDGTLTVFCSIQILDQRPVPSNLDAASQISVTSTVEAACQTTETLTEETASLTPSDGMQTLISNFRDVDLSRRPADISIVVNGVEFLANKAILEANPHVFSTMFDHDVEGNCGRIYIFNKDPENFEKFLLFLYSGKLGIVTAGNAVRLYEIAVKYNVKELKEKCLWYMANEMDIDMFYDVVNLSTKYNESDLLKSAIDFFTDNTHFILPTTRWKNFYVDHPTLCNELLIKVFSKLIIKLLTTEY